MKKHRVFLLLLVCLLAFGLSFALLSCEINFPWDDNGSYGGSGSGAPNTGGGGDSGIASNVVGTWVGYYEGSELRLVFSSNGNYTQYVDGELSGTARWEASGNTIRIFPDGETISGTISGNTMYIAGVALAKR